MPDFLPVSLQNKLRHSESELREQQKVKHKKDNAKWRADDAMSIESAALLPTLSRVDDAFIKLGEKADAYLAMKMSEHLPFSK